MGTITRLDAARLNRQAAEIRIMARDIAGAARLNISCARPPDPEEEVPPLADLLQSIKERTAALAKLEPKMLSEDIHEARVASAWVVFAMLAQARDFELVAAYAEQGTVH